MNHLHPTSAHARQTRTAALGASRGSRLLGGLAVLLATVLLPVTATQAQSSANYSFSTATNASLTDMSSGTTQLVAAGLDDTASAVTDIGFDFYFLGNHFSRFSSSDNGFVRLGNTAIAGNRYALGQAGEALIAALGSDLRVSPTGRVHYKVEGVAPNRVLVVEFLDSTIIWVAAASATADGTHQVRLHEGTGVIELVYGSMARNTSTLTNAQHIGFSLGNAAGAVATVSTENALSTTALTPNLFTVGQAMPSLNSSAQGERRIYTFTPPPAPAAPTDLNFSAVGQFSITLNWTDTAGEVAYHIFRSTNGVDFTQVGSAPADSTSFVASGLQHSTDYSWRVYAVSEGSPSAPLSGSQGTLPPGDVACNGAGGDWGDSSIWATGSIPTAGDNVTIAAGCSVNLNVANAEAINLTIETGGVLQSPLTGTTTNNNLTVSGNVVNNGTLDFSTNGNTSGARLTFGPGPGAADVSLSGSGSITNLRELAVAKGNRATVVTVSPDNLTVRGLATGAPAFLVLTSGTVRFAGSYTLSNPLFSAVGYSIPAAAGLWLDNPNFTVSALTGSPTNSGLLRLSQGTYNVGTAAGNSMGAGTGAVFHIEGGSLNIAGRLQSTSVVQYVQTGGTVNLATVGNTAGTAAFGLTATGNSFDFAGGSIVLVAPSGNGTPLDYSVAQTATFVTAPALTTLQLGSASSPASATYRVTGSTPSLLVTAGRTMNVGSGTGATVLFRGSSLVNDGLIAIQGANSRLDFAANGPMSYSGAGTLGTPATPFAGVGISSNSLFPTTLLSPIYVNRVNLFTGGFINSDQITLGNAGTSTTVVQVGSAGLTTPGGSFDVSPVHNQGSGGQVLLYANESTSRTTGPEVNPTRSLAQLIVDNPNHVQMSGGDLALTSATTALTLTNGRLITGSAVVELTQAAGAVARTNGYVDGNLRKPVAAAGARSFEVGTANGYSPVSFNVTAGTFPTTITASAIEGTAPGFTPAQVAIGRHWNLSATDVTADVTFTYLDPTDLGPVSEAQLRAYRQDGSAYTDVGGTVDTAANTLTVNDVSSFSRWTLAEPAVGVLSIAPGLRDFGDVLISTTSPPLSVTLENTGTAALTVNGIDAPTAPFARAGGSCGATPIELAPDASCTLIYTLAPTVTGEFENILEVTASVTGGSITLRGRGVAAGNLVIAPASVDFGSVLVGSASDVQTISLGNAGTASLQVTGITVANAPFVRTTEGTCGNSLPFTIAVDASCTLSYRFEPTEGGNANQVFTVTADAPGDNSFELRGNGALPPQIFADGFEDLP